jgi:hypothetical protein
MENKVIKIQKWYRGSILRLKQMPLIMYKVQKYLELNNIKFCEATKDGRVNSCIDEKSVIEILLKKFEKRIFIPKIRMWYDISLYDYVYGWIPVNIKITNTNKSDNIGNLATCVYSYTDELLDIYKSYNNGKMSEILFEKLKNKKYNKNHKKDYYFLVLNKNNNKDIIINSIKGLSKLTSNVNNLPFQICWNKNREYIYKNINYSIKQFLECLKKPKPSWKETFMKNIRSLHL